MRTRLAQVHFSFISSKSGPSLAKAAVPVSRQPVAADDDFDAGIVADVLFGLVETEAGDEDFFIIRYDEVFVPGVCNVSLAFGIGRSDRDDAIVFDTIEKDVG